MLQYKNILLAASMTALLSSCGNDFLDLNPSQQIGDEIAIDKIADIPTAVTGAYYWVGHWAFHGRNMTAIGDMGSDNVTNMGATTHLSGLYQYSYQPTSSDLSSIWQSGYKVANYSARIIQSAKGLLQTAPTALDSAHVYQGLSQAYALRGYATFALTNVFALPYEAANLSSPGVVLLEEPKKPFEKMERATVAQSYDFIEEQFELAAHYVAEAQKIATALGGGYKKTIYEGNPWFYFNSTAISAIQARFYLYKGDFDSAKAFAQKAIDTRQGKIILETLAYNQSFDLLPASSEAIFVVKKADDDNLSANSLNTLYNNYGIQISNSLAALYADTDIRKEKMTKKYKSGSNTYYSGGKYEAAVTNIPVIRLPEMYLIVAECALNANNADEARKALFEVARRNTAITAATDLPQDNDELRNFIAQERRRELFQEGHRIFDARRTKETIKVTDGAMTLNAGLFLYPIPLDEINTGLGVVQNDWTAYLPE